MQVASSRNETSFKQGHAPLPGSGRPKGSPNRIKADLAQLILNGAAEAGFLKTNSETNLREASGIDGCQGYLRQLAKNKAYSKMPSYSDVFSMA